MYHFEGSTYKHHCLGHRRHSGCGSMGDTDSSGLGPQSTAGDTQGVQLSTTASTKITNNAMKAIVTIMEQ